MPVIQPLPHPSSSDPLAFAHAGSCKERVAYHHVILSLFFKEW